MKIELVNDHDTIEISNIWEKHHCNSFSLPHRRNLITEAKVTHNGKIIGYGQVRPIAEPILVMDLDARLRYRAAALQLLMAEALAGTRRVGLDRVFAFIRDPELADLIVKRYAFDRADLGEFLIKEF